MADQTDPMTNAERVAAYRARQKEKPLLERLGYPELAERFADEVHQLSNQVTDVQVEVEILNARMAAAVEAMPKGRQRTRALAVLTQDRRLSIKVF